MFSNTGKSQVKRTISLAGIVELWFSQILRIFFYIDCLIHRTESSGIFFLRIPLHNQNKQKKYCSIRMSMAF